MRPAEGLYPSGERRPAEGGGPAGSIHPAWRAFGLLALSAAGAVALGRPLLRAAFQTTLRRAISRLMHDPYPENLWEYVSATRRAGIQNIVETSLRAAHGTVIHRPLGSPRAWPDFRQLVFNYAQVARRPTPHDQPVDMSTTLGPRAARPLQIDIPIMVSGMAYGLALSARTKLALARGAALVGTATNTGEGPVLPLEREVAHRLVVQFGRASWGKDPGRLRQADMIEIQVGQGASGGVGGLVREARDDPKLRALLGLQPGEEAVTASRHPEWAQHGSLGALVHRLRRLGGGVPIAVKLAAGRYLEQDLAACIEAGADVIVLDGGQAATKGSPPILQDDFGVPTLHALVRAERYLRATKQRGKVSLVVSGGLFTPGDYLKALALGADAVYIGTMALFALTHTQAFKSFPWEPPTQVVFFGGHQAGQLDWEEAASHLANYLRSCALEMAVAVRALGKASVRDVSKDDLMALDPHTAQICGVPGTYEAWPGTHEA